MDEKKVKDFFRAVYVERGYNDLDEIKMSWTVVSSRYSIREIVAGLNWICDNVTRRPNSAHFKQALEVEQKFMVQKAIDSIEEALKKYGHNKPEKAKEFLGERLWPCIGYSGGYQHLCRHFDRSNTPFMAQLRDRIQANLENPKKFQSLLAETKEVKGLINKTLNLIGGNDE